MSSTTLILGAGFGGIACARTLRRLLPGEHRVVVVDASPWFIVGAAKTWVMLGSQAAINVRTARRELLPAGVEWVQGEILAIDPDARTVETPAGRLRGDAMVIALGADLDPDSVPGLSRNAETFYSLEGAERLRERLASFAGGKIALLIPKLPFKCPPAPYEAALLLHDHFTGRGMRDRVTLEVGTVEALPMGTAGPMMGKMIVGELERRGIAFRPGLAITRLEPGPVVVYEHGAEPVDLAIAIPPHVAPRVVRECGLAQPGGWIAVEPNTLRVRGRGDAPLYAIGDVAAVSLPGVWKAGMPLALPKAGVFAAAQGEVVAEAIAARLGERRPGPDFDGRGFCYLETGAGAALRADGDFFAMPSPVVTPGAFGPEALADKRRWIEQWLAHPIGGA